MYVKTIPYSTGETTIACHAEPIGEEKRQYGSMKQTDAWNFIIRRRESLSAGMICANSRERLSMVKDTEGKEISEHKSWLNAFLWLENLQRRKERYYRENLEVILRIIPGYDKAILTEAVSVCLDKGIYNGESVKSLCGHIWKKKMGESDVGKNPASRTQSTGLVKTYNEIFRNNGKV